MISILDLIVMPCLNPCQVVKALPSLRQNIIDVARDIVDDVVYGLTRRSNIAALELDFGMSVEDEDDYEGLPELVEVYCSFNSQRVINIPPFCRTLTDRRCAEQQTPIQYR